MKVIVVLGDVGMKELFEDVTRWYVHNDNLYICREDKELAIFQDWTYVREITDTSAKNTKKFVGSEWI